MSVEEFELGTRMASPTSETYTMAEAARLKGVSYHTVSRAVRRGKLPAHRIGKMAFISTEDLSAWQPMVQRAPRKYRRRTPEVDAVPTAIDLASAERVAWAEQIATLIETTRWTAQGLPIEQHLSLLVDRLGATLSLTRVTIWRIDDANNLARRVASYGPPATEFPNEVPLALFPILADLAARHAEHGLALNEYAARNSTSIMVMPIRFGDQFHGALIADRGGETFRLGDGQLVLAQTIADQAAIAFEINSLHQRTAVAAF